jgi:ABC-type bacteriocin/lantibiotic exporter with double-glycine peptidase domain
MEIVVQEEETGCGFANVAMLAKRRYAEVKALANSIGIFAADPRLYSDTAYVRRLLAEYGIRVSEQETPFTSWESLPERALLSIKYNVENGQPFWHWVVFVRESGTPVVLDPAKYLLNNRRTDFEKMQPKWFIEVFGPHSIRSEDRT